MHFLLLIFGLTVLIIGAESIIRGSVSLAKKLKVSLFAIGVVIVAAGTSLPELANCIQTVFLNHSDVAVGAVVGSNIANIILIMGTTALLYPVLIITRNQVKQSIINLFISFGFIIFSLLSLTINYVSGIIFLIILLIIMTYQMKEGQVNINEIEEQKTHSIFFTIFLISIGIAMLIFGSRIFVVAAIEIAKSFQIPESIIGLSIVAFGTSVPELVVGVVSAMKKKVDFALGNILGSNIYNILGILGISSFFGNFKVPILILNYDMYIMLGTVLFICFFMIVIKKLSRLFGILSLIAYIGYISSLYIN